MFQRIKKIMDNLRLDEEFLSSGNCVDYSPIDGNQIAAVPLSDSEKVQTIINRSCAAFEEWQKVPPSNRAELIQKFINELTLHKEDLVELIMIETGKVRLCAEWEFEQALYLARGISAVPKKLAGVISQGEYEKFAVSQKWLPVGPVAVITSFTLPIRVWALNGLMALACGNSVIWRPSRSATLIAYAIDTLFRRAKAQCSFYTPEYLTQILVCDHPEAILLAQSKQIAIMCATGAPSIVRRLQSIVGQRLGRTLLSVGENSAALVEKTADIDLAVREIVFSAYGDAGQRPVSLKRIFCHSSIYDTFVSKLKQKASELYVDSPFEHLAVIGPLLNRESFDVMNMMLDQARVDNGVITGGNRLPVGKFDKAYYVSPCIIELEKQTQTMLSSTLAPILYVVKYDDFDEAIAEINKYEETLVSCLFTNNIVAAGHFMSTSGVKSDAVTINAGSIGSITKNGLSFEHKNICSVGIGSIGFDVAAMFNAGKNGTMFSTFDNSWQTFMQVKNCLINYNCAD